MKESRVINDQNIAESKVILVYSQISEPPKACVRVIYIYILQNGTSIQLIFGQTIAGFKYVN